MFASQPSEALSLLQSVQPASHVPLHLLEPHEGAGTWFGEHVVLQPPQCVMSLETSSSHPSLCLSELQSAKPVLHVPLHVPLPHVRVAMLLFEQTVPQVPQLS